MFFDIKQRICSWFFEIFEKFLFLKYLINTQSAEVNYILSLFVSYVRMPCPDMSKYVQIEFWRSRAWKELVLKRDKNEILKFWKSEVGFELKSLTLIEKDIISLIIFIFDERRGLAVTRFAHNYDENKILKSTFLARWNTSIWISKMPPV